jgi:ectoine hydroxylase-related dioxygenase (phytanoyl-CoA dioxygenase family)
MSFGNQYKPGWEDITEERLPDELLARIDRSDAGPNLTAAQREWAVTGMVYLPKFLPQNLIDAYCTVRSQLDNPGGWRSPTPYVHVKELRDLCLHKPLMAVLKELIGEDCGLHLNLTGWVSTERDFHQDSLLNPPNVGTYYAAVWMALEDISPESGPFQYLPGSHKWAVIRRDKIFSYLTPEEQADESWPAQTQRWVADACMAEAMRRNAPIRTYVPNKGDALVWHSTLIHRGSPPKIPGMQRRALIAHYSALSRRTDMPERRRHENGETYFHFDRPLE